MKRIKKIGLLILLSIGVVIGSVSVSYAQSSPSYGPVFRVEYQTDRPGSDLRSGFPVEHVGQCMNRCVHSSQCQAFTWVDVNQQPPEYNNRRPLCWLKDSVPSKRQNSGMISGIKQ